jgi:hypothetical protein
MCKTALLPLSIPLFLSLTGCRIVVGGDGLAEESVDMGLPDLSLRPDLGGGGATCAQRLADRLAQPMIPPASYAGLELSQGSNPKGLTIDEANADGCVVFDPVDLPTDGTSWSGAGYRPAHWGTGEITASYNVESRVIHRIVLGGQLQGTVAFQSRPGGRYGDHSYVARIGSVTRDGQPFPIGWAGLPDTSLDELYDALVATFAGGTPAVPDCEMSGDCLAYDDADGPAFGVRPLGFYVTGAGGGGPSFPTGFYSLRKGGTVDCTTPAAHREVMDNAPIDPGLSSMGGLQMSKVGSNPLGMTQVEADAIECNSGQVTGAPHPGYGRIQWGQNHELALVYNLTNGVGYLLVATQGYEGTMYAPGPDAHSYAIGVGFIKKDGVDMTIDWSNPAPGVTALQNALGYGKVDADCSSAGHCVITPDDGAGHSTFSFRNTPLTPASSVTIVSPKGTSTPEMIYFTWDQGM